MLIGYARISTGSQSLDLQQDALLKAGCKKIYQDIASGGRDDRPGLNEALQNLKSGDCLVCFRLDRLGRSLRHLLDTMNYLNDRGIGFKSLNEAIDSTTPSGKLIFHFLASISEFEKSLLRSRVVAGLEAARSRGRVGGRPRSLDESSLKVAKALLEEKEISVGEICRTLGISKATLYRSLKNGHR